MRTVVVGANETIARQTRQIVLGAGLECRQGDAVSYADLEMRLSRGGTELVIVGLERDPAAGLATLEKAAALAMAPVVAVGSGQDTSVAERARQLGAMQYLDEGNLRMQLDSALGNMAQPSGNRQQGHIVSVLSPVPGGGATTVAINLAGDWSRLQPDGVSLVEASRRSSDVALRLDLQPKYSVGEVCARWDRLDKTSLVSSFTVHESGLRVLSHPLDAPSQGAELRPEGLRRMAVLLRSAQAVSVLKLDHDLNEGAMELLDLANVICLVVRADVTSLRRARQTLELAGEAGVPVERFRLVVNRYGEPGQLGLRQVEEAVGLNVYHRIPDHPRLANLAANRGKLLRQVSRLAGISRSFHSLALDMKRGLEE